MCTKKICNIAFFIWGGGGGGGGGYSIKDESSLMKIVHVSILVNYINRSPFKHN